MNKIREIVLYIFLGIITIAFLVAIILISNNTISLYFPTGIMNVFTAISEISLYILVFVLIVNSFLPYFVKKDKDRLKNITISLVYFLLATTIISVNVVIWAWIPAFGLTFLLFMLSIFDLFPPKK